MLLDEFFRYKIHDLNFILLPSKNNDLLDSAKIIIFQFLYFVQINSLRVWFIVFDPIAEWLGILTVSLLQSQVDKLEIREDLALVDPSKY